MKEKIKKIKDIGGWIAKPFQKWNHDNAAQLAAAIAYYTVFSISPIIIIALAIASQFFAKDAARAQLVAQISGFFGQETAGLIGMILENSARSSSGFLASIISFVVLLFGATGVFNQVQFALNKIWDVPNNPRRRIWGKLKNRLLSFLMVLVIVFLLPLFLVISAVIPSVNTAPGAQVTWWAQIINLVISFAIMTSLFAMIFRIVPDKEITWMDVWLGAAVTSVLFIIGRYAISLYLLFTRSGSTYGAAGSLIVLLVWVYYSAQIFLLGAEFTQAFSRKFGSHKHMAETPVLPSEPS